MRLTYLFAFLLIGSFACSENSHSHDHEGTADATEATSEEKMTFPEDSVSADGKMSFHGLRIAEENAQPVSKLPVLMASNGDAPVKLAGTVEACCQAKGCWMTMNVDENTPMRVSFKDYGFFVPKDAGGKTAIMEGKAYYDTTSVATLRHFAVDGGMTEEEAAKSITEPKVELLFEATGVIIKEENKTNG